MADNNEAILQKLKEALDSGLLTPEEYEKKVVEFAGKSAAPEVTPEEPTQYTAFEDDGIVYFDETNNMQTRGNSEQSQAFVEQNPEVALGGKQGKKREKKKGKKQGKKKWFIIGGIVLLLVLIGVIGKCGGDGIDETYEWPTDNKIAQMLPVPEGKVTFIYVYDEDGYLDANVSISDVNACKEYIEACKEKGFTKDKVSSQSGHDYNYTAKNEDGWELSVFNFDEEMSIMLESPEYQAELESEEEALADDEDESIDDEEEPVDDETEDADSKSVFSPQDVSDKTIESIETYGDYLIMYEKITDDYLANYEEAVKGTTLYDKDTFNDLKKENDKAFEEQQEQYGSMKDQKLVGKKDLVDYLKEYRDGLKEYVDTISESL